MSDAPETTQAADAAEYPTASPETVVSQDAIEPIEPEVESGPRSYDFQRPVGMADNTRRLLEVAFEEVAASLESWMGAQIREPLEIKVDLVEEARFALFRRDLTSPCIAFLLQIDESPETAVLQLDAELVFTILERAFGSQAEQIFLPDRPLTWIERVVMRDLVVKATELICHAWRDQLPIGLEVAGFESVPEMLPQSNQETAVQGRLKIAGETWVSGLSIVLPGSAVGAALTRKREEQPALEPAQQAENRERIESILQDADLPISVRFPEFAVSLRTISDLQLGTLVQSRLPADAEVEVYVGDKLRFIGRIGRQAGELAVEILESIGPSGKRSDNA